jgi:hypothetical protein
MTLHKTIFLVAYKYCPHNHTTHTSSLWPNHTAKLHFHHPKIAGEFPLNNASTTALASQCPWDANHASSQEQKHLQQFSWEQLPFTTHPVTVLWLVVSTILKNISQGEGLSHILWKIKNV